MTIELSRQDVRRVFLKAQGFIGAPGRRGGVASLLRALGAVQLDTISVLARSHELVPYARLGPIGRAEIESAYWKRDDAFEYWAHAACILPIEMWPYFEYRRRRSRERYKNDGYRAPGREAIARLKAEGPLTATDLGGAKRGGIWWDWSDTKRALEIMLAEGDVVCVERRGWRRVYDLAERAIPDEFLNQTPDDIDCWAHLIGLAGKRLGVATRADLADYFRLRSLDWPTSLEASGLVEVEVKGWRDRAWAHPDALAWLKEGIRGRHRTTLLSPFDSLVWDRDRTLRVFDFHHRLEAYVPKPKRIHGYFAMPLLAGGKLVGRVDPSRRDGALVANKVTVEPANVADLAKALNEAASWVGAESIVVERLDPEDARPELEALLKSS